MNITEVGQVSEHDFSRVPIDAVFAASGYEARASHFCQKFTFAFARNRKAYGFDDRIVLSRETNDECFRRAGYDIIPQIQGDSTQRVCDDFILTINKLAKKQRRIFVAVDFSSMTRAWYAGILQALAQLEDVAATVDIFFNYTPAKYTPPPVRAINTLAGIVPGFCNLAPSDNPLALIIGLGYERIRGIGLREYIDPEKLVLFYNYPVFDEQYARSMYEANRTLLSECAEKDQFPCPIWDLDYTFSKLVDILEDLSTSYRVAIAPLGVKTFSLLSMIAILKFKNADLWRVTGSLQSEPVEREAIGPSLIYRVRFQNNV